MDYVKNQLKKAIFNDERMHLMHHKFISLLRWDVSPEEFSNLAFELNMEVEFLHSQFFAYGCTTEDMYQVLLGDRLKNDPFYLNRIVTYQGKHTDLVKKQSIMKNTKLKAIYPSFLIDVLDQFNNPDNDNKIVDVTPLVLKWRQ